MDPTQFIIHIVQYIYMCLSGRQSARLQHIHLYHTSTCKLQKHISYHRHRLGDCLDTEDRTLTHHTRTHTHTTYKYLHMHIQRHVSTFYSIIAEQAMRQVSHIESIHLNTMLSYYTRRD